MFLRKNEMAKNKKIVTIIPARGGSKSIPKKNIINFCGKPLIAWSIEQALGAKIKNRVYVSTDDTEIAKISKAYGANIIWRPRTLARDTSSSEEALLHAVSEIEKKSAVDFVIFLQATSPIRTSEDIDNAMRCFVSNKADSLFSVALLEDYCIWEIKNNAYKSVTYDYKNRGRRQDRKSCYLENGSIYIFKPEILKKYKNRFGSKVSMYMMPFWKSYEIDNYEDIEICRYFMENKILK